MVLDAEHGFYFAQDFFENWGNRGEKWLNGGAGDCYFILPNGELNQWDRSDKATGEVVLLLSHDVHADPSLLHDASAGPVAEAEGDPRGPIIGTTNVVLAAPGLPPFPEKISAWTSLFNRFDVNSDEHVSPLDVLSIVNELIARASITTRDKRLRHKNEKSPFATCERGFLYVNSKSVSPVAGP